MKVVKCYIRNTKLETVSSIFQYFRNCFQNIYKKSCVAMRQFVWMYMTE